VTSGNFQDISSVQTGMKWDPAVLSFTGINERSFTGLTLNESATEQGELRILWLVDFSDPPLTVADGTVLFEICFDGAGSDGQSSDLEFVDLPNFAVEIANDAAQTLTVCISQGRVSIGEGGSGPGGGGMASGDGVDLCEGTANVGLIMPNDMGDPSDNICLPVTTKNFSEMASIQAAVEWNSAVLSYTELKEVSITGISLNEAETGSGELRLLWLVGLGEDPVTLADDAVLFELCYDLIGADGESSNIEFVDKSNFQIELANGDGQEQASCIDNGFIMVGDGTIDPPPPTGDVTLNAQSLTVTAGSETCVDVTVSNFADIQSAQFNIQWDSTFVTYTRFIDSEVLPSFGETNINLTANNNITVSWNPTSPQTVSNGSTIMTLCFDVASNASCDGVNSSAISFVSTTNRQIEFSNGENELLDFDLNNGSVGLDCEIDPPPPPPPGELGEGIITVPECGDDPTGSIRVDPPSGSASPVTCTWTDEDGTVVSSTTGNCDLTGVRTGTYTLNTVDANGATAARAYLIQAAGPDITWSTVQTTCDGGGSINLDLGATDFGPYTFAWAGGLPAVEDQINLEAATYQVTITDRNNCVYVRSIPLGGAINTGMPLAIELANLEDGSCNGGSRIEIDISGGCSPYTPIWTGPNGESSSEEDIFRVAAGD